MLVVLGGSLDSSETVDFSVFLDQSAYSSDPLKAKKGALAAPTARAPLRLYSKR